jgi:hypothetical protein
VSWEGNIYLKEMPFAKCICAVKKKGSAVQFYKDEMRLVESILEERNITFEVEGEIEPRPREKVKA